MQSFAVLDETDCDRDSLPMRGSVATDDLQCMNVSTPLSQSVSVMIMMIPFPSISEFFVNDKAVLFVLLTPSDIDNLCRCYVIMPW